jgi:hypothetical protein
MDNSGGDAGGGSEEDSGGGGGGGSEEDSAGEGVGDNGELMQVDGDAYLQENWDGLDRDLLRAVRKFSPVSSPESGKEEDTQGACDCHGDTQLDATQLTQLWSDSSEH